MLNVAVVPFRAGSVEPDSGAYDLGAMVTLTATAHYQPFDVLGYFQELPNTLPEHRSFDRWGGDVADSGNPLTVEVDGHLAVTALFARRAITEITDLAGTLTETLEYDENGLVTWSFFDGTGVLSRYTAIDYDADGLVSRATNYDASGTPQSWQTFSYDSEQRLTEGTGFGSDGTAQVFWEHVYDANGRLLSVTGYNAMGAINVQLAAQHDGSGRLVRWNHLDGAGALQIYHTVDYDAVGMPVTVTDYRPDDSRLSYAVLEYDADGLLTRSEAFNDAEASMGGSHYTSPTLMY